MTTYLFRPTGLAAYGKYRVDTGATNNTLATITRVDPPSQIAGSLVTADANGQVNPFLATAATLYLRPLDYQDNPGTAVSAAGSVYPAPAPDSGAQNQGAVQRTGETGTNLDWSGAATVRVPTATVGDNSTKASSTAFVKAAVDALVGGAPGALDTLKELADALGDDASYAATITTALAARVSRTDTGNVNLSGAKVSLPGVISVDAYGADPTGATASDAAITAARAALGSTGVLKFGPGTYRINASTAICGSQMSVEGPGSGISTIDFHGSGPCFQVKDSAFSIVGGADVPASHGGHISGLTISGTNAAAGATGLKAGDMLAFSTSDLVIRGFSGVGSVGLTLDSAVGWFEQANLDVLLANNTIGVLFDEHSSVGSFGYGVYRFTIYGKINQHGMVMKNGAHMVGSDLQIKGNFETGVSNTGKAIWIGATNSSDASYIQASHVDIQAETGGSTGVGHMTWDMSSAATFSGNGILNFLTGGSVGWTDGTVYRQGNTHFMFSGRLNVDANLGVSLFGYGFDAIGSVTGNRGYMDGAAGTIYLGAGNYFDPTLTNGAHTVSFNSPPTGKAMTIDLAIKQPASGAAGTLTWPASVKWTGTGTAPTLSTANGAVDRIRLVTADGVTWYGELVGRAPTTPAAPAHNCKALSLFEPALATNTSALTGGRIYFCKMHLDTSELLTGVRYVVNTAGATLTSGQNLLALYDITGLNRLAITADQTTNFGATGNIDAAFAAAYAAAAGDYLIAILSVGTTPVALARGSASTVSPFAHNLGLTGVNSRFSTYSTGSQTSLPSTLTLANVTAANSLPILVGLY